MTGTIVVGVDGSGGSVRALAWALDEAERRRARLEVVHSWQPSATADMAAPQLRDADFERAAMAILDATLAQIETLPFGVEIKRMVLPGPAASVLLEAAQDAELLVVGSRGLGGFSGLLLGSVSQQCSHHAPCPVVIVPDPAAVD
jgi:nucleotide-binding universal stress UspA family protein